MKNFVFDWAITFLLSNYFRKIVDWYIHVIKKRFLLREVSLMKSTKSINVPPHLVGPKGISRNFITSPIWFSPFVPASHSMQYSCRKRKKWIQEILPAANNALSNFILELADILLSWLWIWFNCWLVWDTGFLSFGGRGSVSFFFIPSMVLTRDVHQNRLFFFQVHSEAEVFWPLCTWKWPCDLLWQMRS